MNAPSPPSTKSLRPSQSQINFFDSRALCGMTAPESTLLVIGGAGELGRAVVSASLTQWSGRVVATYHRTPPPKSLLSSERIAWTVLDCSDHNAIRTLLVSGPFITSVIYCAVPRHGGAAGAGGTSVRCGIVDDTLACAEAAAMIGARFVAISTDLVFDGKKRAGELYKETDNTSPSNAYGRYKVEMENRLRDISGNIVIARTSLILTMDDGEGMTAGVFGKGVQFVVDAINGKHGEIEIFCDELRCMSFSEDLAAGLIELANPNCVHRGLIHLVSDEVTNRWELAKLLARRLGIEEKLGKFAKCGLSKDSGLNRPLNCALDTTLRKQVMKTHIRGITERLGGNLEQ